MAQSYKEYTSSALTATTYSVPFKYLSINDVNALGFDGTKWNALALDSSTPRSATNKTITLAAAPNTLYTTLRLYRATSTTQLIDFQNGSRLSESDLDAAYQQGLFVAQEVAEDASTTQFTAVAVASLQAGTSLSNFASEEIVSDATNGLINGTNAVFNITAFAPQTTVKEAYRVSIDGAMQSPTDAYSITISPAQITFTSAPPTGSKIVVVTAASAASAVSVDDITIGLTSANKAEIKDLGVTNDKLAGSITQDKLAGGITRAKFSSDALSVAYPVGSIYMNASNSDNPSTLLGFGTWAAFGAGKVPVGIDASQTEFDTAEETGGAKTHTLAKTEIPPHQHVYNMKANITGGTTAGGDGYNLGMSTYNTLQGDIGENSNGTGNASPHNNLQPYVVVHMWKRTA